VIVEPKASDEKSRNTEPQIPCFRYFLELAYNGSRYNGWQRQLSAPSVQGTLEEALSKYLREPVEVTGAGRTDTGVHAAYYVAHFDCGVRIADSADFVYHVNAILPADIAIQGITPVDSNAHARFDAVSREYTYYIVPFKEPFRRDTAWQYFVPLDVEAMNCAAEWLLRYDDFTSFAKLNSANKTNICHVIEARWEFSQDGTLVFRIRADRFLRNMVRAIVGTLVDVGRGKISPERFREIIEARDLSLSSGGAPAGGLFLTDITYTNFKPVNQ
jgi:tRNA pseudouridine38-40 synthase